MSGFNALSVRDLVALTIVATRTLVELKTRHDAEQLVMHAFQVADAFVAQSEGRWSDQARASHEKKIEKTDKTERARSG